MKTITKALTTALVLGSAISLAGCANAHDWRGPAVGYGGGWNGPDGYAERSDYLVGSTCSGQRGDALEYRLRVGVERGRIDRGAAWRLQNAIDRLQYREEHECREGDYRAARDIGREYNRISALIGRETGSPTYGYGGYWGR